MSMFPDCRAEGPYNEKNLAGGNELYIDGYDKAVSEVMCLFSNLDVYPEVEQMLDPNVAVVNIDKAKVLQDAVADWLEMSRNEIITALIDGQEEAAGE